MLTRLSTHPFPKNDTDALVGVWTGLQTLLQGVQRWGRFKGLGMEVREQDLVQHTLAITFLGATLISRVRTHLPTIFDDRLVLTTLMVHDVGEAMLGRDVSVTLKGTAHDVAEYVSFCQFIDEMPADMQLYYKTAFLLQFVLDEAKWSLFDADAQAIMAELAATRHYEAVMFKITEHYDYIMFMIEHHEKGNSYLLYEAMKTEISVWPKLKKLLPAFGEIIFPPEVEGWLMEFRRLYEEAGGETRSTYEIVAARV
ncbi:MAG: hypothetical protein UT91_C0017G0005 [Parcubacteria group bacterium GW2011_GWA2_40_23]|nr:MAG: hypothetical protein UT91_C0017G0005 [Parcubacteria group bacterium GW2011_GWA2_40_23]